MDYDILVIDDDKSIRKLLSSIIKKAGYSFSTAESGPIGLKLLETNTYQLILLDLKMPGMNGAETLYKIREIDTKVPVYIVSAFYGEYLEELKSLSEDGLEFQILNKPIEKVQILKLLNGTISIKLDTKKEIVKFRLYVVGNPQKTIVSINNLHETFQSQLMNEYSLEIIDVIKNPTLAMQDEVFATPTLLKISPKPTQRIVGDLTMREMILQRFGLVVNENQCS